MRSETRTANAALARTLMASSATEIEGLFRTLGAGPMPSWRESADGLVRGTTQLAWLGRIGDFGTGVPARVLNAVVPPIWAGKIFYTDDCAGHLRNRMLPWLLETRAARERRGRAGVWRGRVGYGISASDGRQSIIIDYPWPDSGLFGGFRIFGRRLTTGGIDECRTASPGLLLCRGFYDFAPLGKKVLVCYFTLSY